MQVEFSRFTVTKEQYALVSDTLDREVNNQVELLEEEFASYVEAKYALATSSGSSAIHLAMLALELKRGDKILCSINSFAYIPEAVRHFDAEPIFIDIDEENYNMNLDKLETYLQKNKSKKLKAVIVSHIGGICVDLERLYDIAKKYNIKVVEDANEAFGATHQDKKIGSSGADMVCFDFSTHLKKDICNGGMLVSDDEDLINKAKMLRYHGIVKNNENLQYIYDVLDIGYNYTMSELEAAYIRAKLESQNDKITRQQNIACIYNQELQGTPHVTLPNDTNGCPYFLYIIKIDKNRDGFALELKNLGIECGLHYIPFNFLTYYKNKYNLRIMDFPMALKSYQQILSLPIYADMSDEEVAYVCKCIKKVASSRV